MNCALIGRYAGAFIDGELDPASQLEFEQHLNQCARCQERVTFERSVSEQTRDALSAVAPATLRQRVLRALDTEVAADRSSRRPLIEIRPWNWKQGWPVAAAAAAVLMIGSVVKLSGQTSVQTAGVLEDMVTLHSETLPSDVQAPPEEVPQRVSQYFAGKVRFPVRPAEFDRNDARLVGARLSNVRERRAAALYYDLGGRRVTVVVFERSEMPTPARVANVGGRQVFYYDAAGHTIPVRSRAGLNYAFMGDLDRDALMRLAASARVP